MARKSKPRSVEEILATRAFHESQLTPTEAETIAEAQKSLVDEQMKSDISEIASLVLKPRLEIVEAVQKAGEDSPLGRAEHIVRANVRAPVALERVPISPRPSPQLLCPMIYRYGKHPV